MTPRQLQRYMIQQREKMFDTKPEVFFDSFCMKYGLLSQDCKPILMGEFTFRPDRMLCLNNGHRFYVEIDGPYHRTPKQEKKTKWRDKRITDMGQRVLHIDSELVLKSEYWPYVWQAIVKFSMNGKGSDHIYA